MSSHWEWEKKVVAEHELLKPFAPENGQELLFTPGTPVIFTNDYGLEFPLTVTGYYSPHTPDSFYARGYRYMTDSGAYWFPKTESSLRLDPSRTTLSYEAKSYVHRKQYKSMWELSGSAPVACECGEAFINIETFNPGWI